MNLDPNKKDFKVYKHFDYQKNHSSSIWALYQNRQEFKYTFGSETDVQHCVSCVLTDILNQCRLATHVRTYSEISVTVPSSKSREPDMWMVKNEYGTPIGVVEIKRPDGGEKKEEEEEKQTGSSGTTRKSARIKEKKEETQNTEETSIFKTMKHSQVHGQIFDYMLLLKHFYGLKYIFGIVTNYMEWRIYWLPTSDDAAARALLIPEQQQQQQSKEEEEEEEKEEMDIKEGKKEKKKEKMFFRMGEKEVLTEIPLKTKLQQARKEVKDRVICATQAISYQDSKLIDAISTVA